MGRNIDLSNTQQYLEWLKTKLYLDSIAPNAKNRVVKRGEVYKCNLGKGIGSEECKERPCLVIQNDAGNIRSPNVIVAPITHTNSTLPIVVPLANQYDSSGQILLNGNVLLGNIICVSKARLGDYVTKLNSDEMKKVDEAIAVSLDIKRHYDTLKNILDDKLDYIDKLKKKIRNLEEDKSQYVNMFSKFDDLQKELGFEGFDDMIEQIKLRFKK
ncbi:type II toxin-antitoxin system PemK/MazF family toxin [Anaerobranca gottschalkii]|uniref:mRNA interferase MazF n=1 Tax=Anaerobranca gottschalkii DSM 13577 TaxID=1120990 RepID=A0A1I0CU43_9FIRM|nr:type II toxin-antitoxin system PemK/MazF family toxin [Anaerobranca gottschalkii]SET23058.1 mRNA interferase MazF [Anaerobranca gottschalkii DSM 13577]